MTLKFTATTIVAVALAGAPGLGGVQATERLGNGNSLYGVPYVGGKADHVVELGTSQFINIKCGQTVLFRQAGKVFAWKFDVVGHRAVDLAKIAPAGFRVKDFKVYVDRNASERA